ncbi:MAG: hypothetical protein KQI35_15030 [Bacteroidetes bacterium]|nr:hypothetical protein [Bacteroidota bacterium]
MMNAIKKDHYLFGLLVGILVPLILYGIILLFNYMLLIMGVAKFYLDHETHVLVSLFGNLLPIRYYFVNLVYDKTGRGVLLITFVVVLLFFIFKDFLGISV